MNEIPKITPKEQTSTAKEKIRGAEARRAKVEGLKKEGFATEEQKKWVVDRIVDIALPVDNYRSLHRKRNRYGSENVLGSWGIGLANYGEFSIYELLDKQIKEKQIGTITHEGAHANSPLNEKNSFIFGSEAARKAAAEHAKGVANQTILTNKFLNGYHKHLYERLVSKDIPAKDRISRETFDEETWAILAELALTNRAHLEQVQEAHHKALDRLKGTGVDVPDKVYLMSHEEKGEMDVDGVDVAMINLLDGIDDLTALEGHVMFLKGEFYSEDSLNTAYKRFQKLDEERKKKKEEEEEKEKKEVQILEDIRIQNEEKEREAQLATEPSKPKETKTTDITKKD